MIISRISWIFFHDLRSKKQHESILFRCLALCSFSPWWVIKIGFEINGYNFFCFCILSIFYVRTFVCVFISPLTTLFKTWKTWKTKSFLMLRLKCKKATNYLLELLINLRKLVLLFTHSLRMLHKFQRIYLHFLYLMRINFFPQHKFFRLYLHFIIVDIPNIFILQVCTTRKITIFTTQHLTQITVFHFRI